MKEKVKNEMNKDDFREMAGKIQNIEDSEELRKILGNIILDRFAREDGQKPADEWKRRDFANLYHNHRDFQKLTTGDLRALFLDFAVVIDGVFYYELENVRGARRRRANGRQPNYFLAIPDAVADAAGRGDAAAVQQAEDIKRKLDAIGSNL